MPTALESARNDPGSFVDTVDTSAHGEGPVDTNLDARVVEGFGQEWSTLDQTGLSDEERQELFGRYFRDFPWEALPSDAKAFDAGCGSGRWARLVAPRVGALHCVDPSEAVVETARRNLADLDNCVVHQASVGALPFEDGSMDMGYSLGVLHHIPDTAAGLQACVRKLKPGAPFLLYLYYAFDNRPAWFRAIWRVSDVFRRAISKLPFRLRYWVTQPIALFVYWPLARTALLLERLGLNVAAFPLSAYRDLSFYTMRTCALDRFGTRIEHRFTAAQIRTMMEGAGLERIRFSDSVPHWVAFGFKS